MDSLLLVYCTTAALVLIPTVSTIYFVPSHRTMNTLSSLFFELRAVFRDTASWRGRHILGLGVRSHVF